MDNHESISSSASSQPTLVQAHVENVKVYIQDHLYETLSLSELAKRGGFSRYYFARRFKAATGVSPKQYVLARRLEQAHSLLCQGGLTVSEVAHQTGFTDQSHLVRYFKKCWGVTPRALLGQSESVKRLEFTEKSQAAPESFLASTPLTSYPAATSYPSAF